jgi:hypothetical protein
MRFITRLRELADGLQTAAGRGGARFQGACDGVIERGDSDRCRYQIGFHHILNQINIPLNQRRFGDYPYRILCLNLFRRKAGFTLSRIAAATFLQIARKFLRLTNLRRNHHEPVY